VLVHRLLLRTGPVRFAQYLYVYTVRTAAEHGFSANQEMLLGRPWASFKTGVNNGDTSAAFQMAVWELSFDAGSDLETGTFLGNGNVTIVTLAQSYLDAITSPSCSVGQHEIRVLHNDTVQDQLIPNPGLARSAGSWWPRRGSSSPLIDLRQQSA
jgi:hypothetical protein